VDGSACEVIDTGIVKVTGRDGKVRALEAVRYVSEARYNLISIRVLDDQHDFVTFSCPYLSIICL